LFQSSSVKKLKKLVGILEEDEHGPFVSIHLRLVLIDGTVSTIFRVNVLCRTARSFENSGNLTRQFTFYARNMHDS